MKLLIRIFPFIVVILALASCASTTNKDKTPFGAAKTSYEQAHYEDAFAKIQGPAKAGNADAEYVLGYMYYYGKGTTINQDLGKQWILKSAQAGNKKAQQAYQMILAREQQVIPTGHSANISSSELPAAKLKSMPTKMQKISKPHKVTTTNTTSQVTAMTYTGVEQKLLAYNPKHYTLQLLGASKASYASAYINKYKLGANAHYFHRKLKGKDLYVVVYGNYATRQKALLGLKSLPTAVQALKPWARDMAGIQAQIRGKA